MKKIIIGLIALFSFLQSFAQSAGNDTTLYIYYRYTYGNALDRYWAKRVLMTPADTTFSKDGIAMKNGVLYVGDGTKWSAVGSGGPGGSDSGIVNGLWVTVDRNTATFRRVNSDSAGMASYFLRRKDSGVYYITPKRLADSSAVLRGLISSGFDSTTSQGGGFHTQAYNDARYKRLVDSLITTGSYATIGRLYKVADSLSALADTTINRSTGATGLPIFTQYNVGRVYGLNFPLIRDTSLATSRWAPDSAFVIATHDTTSTNALASKSQLDSAKQNIWAGITSKMTNYGNAPGSVEFNYTSIPSATSYPTGTTLIVPDSGFHYVDTGSGGSRGWKRIAGGSGGSGASPGNPAAAIGLAPTNGSASTFMRSDAAPRLDSSAYKSVYLPLNLNNAKTVNYGGYGTYYNNGYSLYDSIRFTYFLRPDTIFAEGNSITVGQGATTPTTGGYIYLIGTKLSISIVNGSLSGSGMWHSISDHNQRRQPGMTVMTTVMAGFNDVRRNGLAATKKITNALNAIFINHFLNRWTPGGTVGTRYGTWGTNYTASTLGGKSVGNGGFTSTNNDSLVYTFTDSTVVLGLMGADGTAGAYTYSTFDVYIDNVLKGHYTENNQTDGVSDGVYDNKRSPMALFYTGLTYGSHTIKLVNTGTTGASFFVVDYIGHLVDATTAPAMVVFHAPKMDATGYATSPSSASDWAIDGINASLDSTIALMPAPYKVITAKTNTTYIATTASGLSGDHIHPNDLGHSQIAQAFYNAANYSTPPNGSIYHDGTHFYGVLSGVGVQFDNLSNTVTGTGSSNTLAKWSSASTVAASSFNDNGTVSYTTQSFGVGGSPSERLHVTGTNPSLLLENSSTQRGYVNQFGNFLQFGINRNPGTGTINNTSAGTAALQLEQGSNFGKIHFLVSSANNVSPTEQFTMLSSSGVGNFGIGNTAPGSRIDIVGTHPDMRFYDTLSAVNVQSNIGQLNGLAVWGVNRNPVTGSTSNVNNSAAEIRMESTNGESLIHWYTTTTNNTSPTEWLRLKGNGHLLLNTLTDSNAFVHIGAGTTSNAPLKFTAGSLLTTPKNGTFEFDGSHFYGTAGGTRYQLDQQGGGTNYQTVQVNASSATQRAKLNFSSQFTATDNSGNGSTDVSLTSVTTQSPGDNSTKPASTAYVDAAVSSSGGSSGLYKPTITNGSNAASITSDTAMWIRQGNNVIVDGKFDVTPTSGSVNTTVDIALPFNSQLTGGHACWGQGMTSQVSGGGGAGAVVFYGGTANAARLLFYQTGLTSALTVYYHFQYNVQ